MDALFEVETYHPLRRIEEGSQLRKQKEQQDKVPASGPQIGSDSATKDSKESNHHTSSPKAHK
jgi:hypothetical protein